MFCFLISDAGKETLGGGEEKLDDHFTYKEGDEATYFVSEGLGDQKLDVGPSGGGATNSGKGEVATQGYESDDVEILEVPREWRLIIEPPAKEPAIGKALVKTTTAEGVTRFESVPEDVIGSKMDSHVVHTIEVSSTDTAAAEDTSHTKTVLAIISCTEVVTAGTSAPLGNDHNKSLTINFSYVVFNPGAFAETLSLTALVTGSP